MPSKANESDVGCERYICLAEYRCSCRPCGVPVSRNTMLRHRKAANLRRRAQNLPDLPWGPRYTAYRATEVSMRYRSIPIADRAEWEPYSFSQPQPQVRVHEVVQPDSIDVRTSVDAAASIEQRSNSIYCSRLVPHASDVIVPIQSQNDCNYYHSDSSDHANDATELDDLPLNQSTSATDSAEGQYIRNSRAFLSFRAWAMDNKQWVQTCLEFAVTVALFDRILENISAPYKSITVKRNLIKYAGLYTEKYATCRPHMLLCRSEAEGKSVANVHENMQCVICASTGTIPDMTDFEYIPLKPRILAWFRTEQSYKDLTDYRQRKEAERSANQFQAGSMYEDYFDGQWYKEIVDRLGGPEAVKNDIFLSLSTDGFQTFENQSYDCWPIMALNNNLHPSKRFLLKNVVPLGYIKGPKEPRLLDSFFIPLVDELRDINMDGGMEVETWNGSTVRIRVHVLWITADKQARNKIAGLAGQNSKSPCEDCSIQGVWCPSSRHLIIYYFPSKVPVTESPEGVRRRFEILFNIDALPMRSVESVKEVWDLFNSDSLTKAERQKLIRETGIKPKTSVFEIESVTPFLSFPQDSMHLIMNISRDIFELLKGENRHLARGNFGNANEFIIPASSWDRIDEEIRTIGRGTSLSSFGPPPRPTSFYRNYKAAELKEFFCSYALVLFEGHLPRMYMKGLQYFSKVVELCRRPVMNANDLNDLDINAKAFYRHMEERYYRYEKRRIGIMKSTLHTILHLRSQVERYGPMTNYNQFWVERRIGDEKAKLNATIRAAESMTERAKLIESSKIFYEDHFVHPTEDLNHIRDDSDSFSQSGMRPLLPLTQCNLNDAVNRSYRMRKLLESYLTRKGTPLSEVTQETSNDNVCVYGRLRIPCGETSIVVGAMKTRRHRSRMERADWYVSTEFEYEDGSGYRQVFYGRILQILSYSFKSHSNDRILLLMDWAKDVRCNEFGQIYTESPLRSAFRNPTIEDVSILLNSVGVFEHQVRNQTKRTYILDPHRESNRLLQRGVAGADGVVRNLHARR